MQGRIQNFHWLWWSAAIFLLDQLSKNMAFSALQPYYPVEILPFFNLTLAFNTGAAFSFLSTAGGWQQWLFGGVAVVISVIILVWLYQLPKTDKLGAVALASILGGAIGNLSDRLTRGYVVDFLDFHLYNYHWPIFNIADIAISLGAGLYICILLFRKEHA